MVRSDSFAMLSRMFRDWQTKLSAAICSDVMGALNASSGTLVLDASGVGFDMFNATVRRRSMSTQLHFLE